MEFTDRVSSSNGTIKLTHSDGTVELCKIALNDSATTQGTPLNAETFRQFREDIMNAVANYTVGEKGEKGDKGDKGDKGEPGDGATDLTGYATETFVEAAISNAIGAALNKSY